MDLQNKIPVFYDPLNKRWPRIKYLFLILFFSLFILGSAFILGIYLMPGLNSLPLKPLNNLSSIPYRAHKIRHQHFKNTHPLALPKKRNKSSQSYSPKIIAFLINYDTGSFKSFMKHINKIDVVIGEYLHLDSAKGEVIEDNPTMQKELSRFVSTNPSKPQLIALVNNIKNQNWQPKMLEEMLSSPASQATLIQNLLTYVQKNHFAGINIDFEMVPESSRKHLTQFMIQLAKEFHNAGLSVSMDVADEPVYDLAALANTLDYFVIMSYDEHSDSDTAGPIASIDWVSKFIAKTLKKIPASKLVVGIGNYGEDWIKNKKQAEHTAFHEEMNTAQTASASIVFNSPSLNPMYTYLEDNTIAHEVWFLDAITAFNQMAVSQQVQPYGYALWRLGSEDPSFWKIAGHVVGANDIEPLQIIDPLDQIVYQGEGEVLRVIKEPEAGFRKVTYDSKQHLISNEVYQKLPSSYLINRYDAVSPKKVALTFDDGPDVKYTPQILNILKDMGVKATFFVIGTNALMQTELLQREYVEGHDIGNHTFTHPDVSEISTSQLLMEVNATQRVLAYYLGIESHLYRPPYGEDAELDSTEHVKGITAVSKLGYIIVGADIDPTDWALPGTEKIVQSIIKDVNDHKGSIILLHDSGGNREQTVQALPSIITELKARGYELVTVSELLGLTKAEVMPIKGFAQNPWELSVEFITLNTMYYGFTSIKILFFIAIILGLVQMITLSILAVYHKIKDKDLSKLPQPNTSVAVIIPAYNEEKVILKSIKRLLEIDHPSQFEIIFVDDGSTDNTLQLVRDTYGADPRVKVLTQPNGGKPSALNYGIQHTQAELIVTIDADTLFMKTTITELIHPFADPKIGAVAGNIKVGNKINLLTKLQGIEYITSQNFERRAYKVMNAITVVSGCIGAWRRELIIAAGGFTDDTLAEDADLTIKISRLGYTIFYSDKAIGYTEVPDDIKSFLKQRYRWMFGTFQVAWKHADALFKPRYSFLGFVALPRMFLNQIIFPLIAPLLDLLLVLTLVSVLINRFYHPVEYDADTLVSVLSYYVLFTLIDFITGFISFALEPTESKKQLFLLLPQRFFYRQLVYYSAIKTLLSALSGKLVGWKNTIRKATVSERET